MGMQANGKLWLYRGNGKGGWISSVLVGSGWQDFTSIFSLGDFTGDGIPDVLVTDSGGTVWVYPYLKRFTWLCHLWLGAVDGLVWDHARDHGFMIVSKDNDFRQRSFLDGAPPKVIWLRVGNAGTAAIAGLLRREQARIGAFGLDVEGALLVLALDDVA